jgi:hypothetical protein
MRSAIRPPRAGGLSPSFALNFLSETFPSGLTFTRSSNATRIGPTGLLETVASNTPRIDYDPVTLVAKGLLIEEVRTNLAINSAATAANTGTTVTVDATNMFGTANAATTVNEGVADSLHFAFSGGAVSWTIGTVCSCTAYIEAGTATRAQITVTTDGSVGTATTYANFGLTGAGFVLAEGAAAVGMIRLVAPGVYACTMKFTAGATVPITTPVIVGMINSGTATRLPSYTGTGLTLVVHGAQIEAGATATTYIPTSGATATRAADVCSATLGAWFNQPASSVVVEFQAGIIDASSRRVVGWRNASGTDSIHVVRSIARAAQIRSAVAGGADFTPSTANSSADGVIVKYGASIEFGTAVTKRLCLNGGTVATSAVAVSAVAYTVMDIGVAFSSQQINGHIRRIAYYRQALSAAQLQALTA